MKMLPRLFHITARQDRILREIEQESGLCHAELVRRALDLYITTWRSGLRPHATKPSAASPKIQKKAIAGGQP